MVAPRFLRVLRMFCGLPTPLEKARLECVLSGLAPLAGDRCQDKAKRIFDIGEFDELGGDFVFRATVVVIAQWDRNPGAADPVGLKRGGFAGAPIQ